MAELTAKKLVELRDKFPRNKIERLVGLREAIISGPEETAKFAQKKHMSIGVIRSECRLLKEEGIWPLD